MAKQRNPEARCGTCPYWHGPLTYPEGMQPDDMVGECRRWPLKENITERDYWCGEHPDFWLSKTSPRLNEVSRLQAEVNELKKAGMAVIEELSDGRPLPCGKAEYELRALLTKKSKEPNTP